MGKRTIVAAAGLATAAVVIPITLVLAGAPNQVGGDVAHQALTYTTKPHKAPKEWKSVPEVGSVGTSGGAHSVTVSAQMTDGKAKFRVISEGGATPPGAVTYSANAANSFTFGYPEGCYFHANNKVQWKRVGKHAATASKITVLDLSTNEPCF